MSSKKIILVTGANGAIGRAIALRFLEISGDNFVWLGIHSQTDGVAEIETKFQGRCSRIQLDVVEQNSWKDAVLKIQNESGRLDVLVNNAGGHRDGLLAQMPLEVWNDVIQKNLSSVFHGCQAVMPVMIGQRRGRIVNISSLSALLAPAGQANYAAAKAGVVALTQSLAKEVARIGITVNAICPGYIGDETSTAAPDDARKALEQRIPMRRVGRPEEVAAAVCFLACDEASYITGSVLKVDGGIL